LEIDNAYYSQKLLFVRCGFSIDYVSSNDDNAVKLTEDEEDD
jgi:hypothetical protein